MSDAKKYYYLKLKENFFDSEELILLESMPDGYMYSNILLKLYLRSLKNNGKLMVNERIPYNSAMLSNVTRHPVAVVEKAIKTFIDLGIIEILGNGAIYLADIQNFIGESSTEADRKRLYRNKIEQEKKLLTGQMSRQTSPECPDNSPPEIEIDIELEKELEKKKEIEKKKDKKNKAAPFSDYTKNQELISALNDFVKMRKQIKAPMTDRAIKLFLDKLDSMTNDEAEKVAILNQSIMSSWKGIFPLKSIQECKQGRNPQVDMAQEAIEAIMNAE